MNTEDMEDETEVEVLDKDESMNTTSDNLCVNKGKHQDVIITKESGSFTCEICGRQFKIKYMYNRHIFTHTGARPFECTICKKKFKKRSHLTVHTRQHTGEKPFSCPVCGIKSRDKCYINKHLLTHYITDKGQKVNKTVHKCNLKSCGREFDVLQELKDHLNIHLDETPYKCTFCNRAFYKKSHLNMHLFLHKGQRPKKCEICDKSLLHVAKLSAHMKYHEYEEDRVDITLHPMCTVCGKMFRNPTKLREHAMVHSKEKPFSCTFCQRSYKKKSNLKIHMNRSHVGDNFDICQEIEKQINETSTNSSNTQVECIECGFVFPNVQDLDVHMFTHTGGKNHCCEECGMRFGSERLVSRHMRCHTGEISFQSDEDT